MEKKRPCKKGGLAIIYWRGFPYFVFSLSLPNVEVSENAGRWALPLFAVAKGCQHTKTFNLISTRVATGYLSHFKCSRIK